MKRHGPVVLLVLLTACNQAPPSADEAKRAFEARIRGDAQGAPFQITAFEKTNGQSLEAGGVRAYKFFYKATVAFPNGLRPDCIRSDGSFAGFNCAFAQMNSVEKISPKPVGAEVTYHGQIEYEKLERGWQIDRVSLQQDSVFIPPPKPPTEAELAAGRQYQRDQASQQLAKCTRFVTTAQFEELEKAAPVVPDKNRISIDGKGGIAWNGVPVDETLLSQYLEAMTQLNPAPYLIFDPSSDEQKNEVVRMAVYRSGLC